MLHELNILPEYFQAVKTGIKTFEVRKNDRGFEVGDILILREWDGTYTGPNIKVKTTYILGNFEGLKEDYIVMAIVHIS